MSEHVAAIAWQRQGAGFRYETYPRDHDWRFSNGVTLAASAAPAFLGSEERVDPEETFVASVASCHMLTFLAIAARRRKVVDRYEDDAVGLLEKNEEGRHAITRVVLRPRITFEGDTPSDAEVARMHELAHQNCFIANSVRTRIEVAAPAATSPPAT